jgi:hypothetical protein
LQREQLADPHAGAQRDEDHRAPLTFRGRSVIAIVTDSALARVLLAGFGLATEPSTFARRARRPKPTSPGTTPCRSYRFDPASSACCHSNVPALTQVSSSQEARRHTRPALAETAVAKPRLNFLAASVVFHTSAPLYGVGSRSTPTSQAESFGPEETR